MTMRPPQMMKPRIITQAFERLTTRDDEYEGFNAFCARLQPELDNGWQMGPYAQVNGAITEIILVKAIVPEPKIQITPKEPITTKPVETPPTDKPVAKPEPEPQTEPLILPAEQKP